MCALISLGQIFKSDYLMYLGDENAVTSDQDQLRSIKEYRNSKNENMVFIKNNQN